jgi:CheY-like chemotaxis protein
MTESTIAAVPNVLIVDDDSEFRELLGMVLADAGFTCRAAKDGEEGLALLRTVRGENPTAPCVVILDLMMPRLDGRGFMKAQLNDPLLANTPVIVISAAADVLRIGQNPPAAVLTKPVDVDELVDIIRAQCDS